MNGRRDFEVRQSGGIGLIRPLTDKARAWLQANVAAESWQWTGPELACEVRYVLDIVQAMRAGGMIGGGA